MKIQLELKDPKTESTYLGLRKALPDLTPEEIEAGVNETGVVPLCKASLNEKLFLLGLQIMIEEFTNPGASIASAHAKTVDLKLLKGFTTKFRETIAAIAKEKAERTKKLGPKKAAAILKAFRTAHKAVGDTGFAWFISDYRLGAFEQALGLAGQVMADDQGIVTPEPATKEKKTDVRHQGVPLPRSRPVRRRRR